jgi:hypothetical protein
VTEKVERVTAKVPKVTAKVAKVIGRAVKEPKAVKEAVIMVRTMTNQGESCTAAHVSGQESHVESTANMTQRHAADTEAAWKGTISTTVSQSNRDSTGSTTNRSANRTGRRQKQRAQTLLMKKSSKRRGRSRWSRRRCNGGDKQCYHGALVWHARAEQVAKESLAHQRLRTDYSFRGSGVYDGQGGEEVVRKNRAERENRAESEL